MSRFGVSGLAAGLQGFGALKRALGHKRCSG